MLRIHRDDRVRGRLQLLRASTALTLLPLALLASSPAAAETAAPRSTELPRFTVTTPRPGGPTAPKQKRRVRPASVAAPVVAPVPGPPATPVGPVGPVTPVGPVVTPLNTGAVPG